MEERPLVPMAEPRLGPERLQAVLGTVPGFQVPPVPSPYLESCPGTFDPKSTGKIGQLRVPRSRRRQVVTGGKTDFCYQKLHRSWKRKHFLSSVLIFGFSTFSASQIHCLMLGLTAHHSTHPAVTGGTISFPHPFCSASVPQF